MLDKYAANQDKLKSFIVRTDITYLTDLTEDETVSHSSLEKDIVELRYEGDADGFRAYFCPKRVHSAEDGSLVPADRYHNHSFLWDGERYFGHYRGPVLDESSVVISFSVKYIKDAITIGYAGSGSILGLLYGDVERFDSILRQADSITVRDELERVGSGDCYVIDAKTKHGTYKIWLDPERGYGIAKADTHKGAKDLWWGRPLDYFTHAPYMPNVISIRNVRFESIEGIWVPMEVDFRVDSKDFKGSNRSSVSNVHHKVTELLLNPDHDALGSFVPDIKNGTTVRILGVPGIKYTWHDRKKFVVDEWDGSIRYVPKEWSMLVGVGKPLPKFEGIKLRLSAQQTKDRAILLCFFDMNQRPSRNCIIRLAKQAQQLKQKGVTIVAVQASKTDENTLNEWLKKYNIPFTIGIVQDDVEKTKFTWGIRSLPWLILTDPEHVVIAECFGIDELDEKLKKNIDTEHAIQKNKATPTKPVAQTDLSDPVKSFLDAVEILKSWEDNYAYFKSMKVSYTERVLEAKPPAKNPHRYENLVMVMHVERVEQGNRFHIRYSTTEDGFAQPESIIEGSFDGRITQEYIASEKSGMIIRSMIGRNTETMNRLKNYMLLNRKMLTKRNDSKSFKTYWVEDPNSKPELSRILESAMSKSKVLVVSVLPKLEPIAGQLCHVLETTFRGNKSRKIWLAHEKGMLPLKYQRYVNNKPVSEIEVEQIDRIETNRGDIWFPKKAYRSSNYQNMGRIKYELTVHTFVPNIKVDDNTFRFEFPKGTYISDRIRGIWGVDLPKEPPLLVGKPLPELKDFNYKIDVNQTKDRMILICFFDMQQRPSRNCIMRLAKQAEQLKQRGVTIVAIQASKIDENKLKEWVKNYNIPFAVGMVQGDVEKSRFAWGVRSLPWLILIDPDHTVCAEGFDLAELDEKINTITQP